MSLVRATSLLALFALACSGEPSPGAGDAGSTARDGGGSDAGAFTVTVLDPDAPGAYPVSLAIHGDTIGVSYFVESLSPDGGVGRELRYVERGAAPEAVTTVVRAEFGQSLAYDSSGQAHIAFLSPPSNQGTFWYEASVGLASRGAGGWTTAPVFSIATEVIGLWPALAIDEGGAFHLGYKGVGNAQFEVQGAEHTDLGYITGRPGAWTTDGVAVEGADRQEGHGTRTAVVLAGGQPAFAWSGQPGLQANPRGVYFIQREASGWPANPRTLKESINTVTGPSLAWDSEAGFLIAYEDHGKGVASVIESRDGADWSVADPFHGAGTGGWHPSAAFSPEGLPSVAYYVCSFRSGADQCPAEEDELVYAWRVEGQWRKLTADPQGGHYPKLGYLGGRAIIVYKDVDDRALKLAVQR